MRLTNLLPHSSEKERLLTPISIQRIASAAAKAAVCWSGGALAQASTAHFSATPSTAWRMVNVAPVVIAAARPKRATAAAASGLIAIEK
jgi:hypothetical protein